MGSSREEGNPFELFQVVWQPNIAPKMSICLIRAIHNKLLTREKLLSIGIVDSDTCPLCLSGQESRNHFFFASPYSAYM